MTGRLSRPGPARPGRRREAFHVRGDLRELGDRELGPSASTMARNMAFSSWRTLPGQG